MRFDEVTTRVVYQNGEWVVGPLRASGPGPSPAELAQTIADDLIERLARHWILRDLPSTPEELEAWKTHHRAAITATIDQRAAELFDATIADWNNLKTALEPHLMQVMSATAAYEAFVRDDIQNIVTAGLERKAREAIDL